MTRLLDYFRIGLWERDLRKANWLVRLGLGALRAVVHMVTMFEEHFLSVRAGALTVTTLLAVVPLAAAGLSVAKAFGFQEDLNRLLMESAAELPSHFGQMVDRLRGLVDEIEFGKLGLLSTLLVLYAGLSLFVNVEHSLNHTWNSTRQRSWVRRVLDFLAMIFVVPGLVVGAMAISGVLQSAKDEGSWLSEYSWLVALYDYGLFFVPFVMVGVAFTTIYKFMPNAPVRWYAAAIGGFVAGSAVLLMHLLYLSLQVGVARSNAIYGTLAALPLLIVYLQLAWTIVLLGAELSHAAQHADLLGAGRQVRNPTPILRERIALAVVQRTSEAFLAGDGETRLSELASDVDVPRTVLDEVVGALIEVGVLARCGESSVLPAHPPETITVEVVRSAMRGHLPESLGSRLALPEPLEAALAGSEQSQRETLGQATFSQATYSQVS